MIFRVGVSSTWSGLDWYSLGFVKTTFKKLETTRRGHEKYLGSIHCYDWGKFGGVKGARRHSSFTQGGLWNCTFTVNPVSSVVSQHTFRIQEEVSDIPFNLIRLLICIMSFFFSLLSSVLIKKNFSPRNLWPLQPMMHMPCGCGIRSLPLQAWVNSATIPGIAVNGGGRKCL